MAKPKHDPQDVAIAKFAAALITSIAGTEWSSADLLELANIIRLSGGAWLDRSEMNKLKKALNTKN